MAVRDFITELTVRIRFTDEALGMMPSNPAIHEEYIASKSPDAATIEEEVKAVGVEEVIEKMMTVFPKEDGAPFFWDYQIRGFFKDSIGMLRRIPKSECAKLKNYKKVVDGLIQIKERRVPIALSGPMGDCQRPLRAETAQGARVALANSETVPAGSEMTFTVQMFDKSLESAVRECLDYGEFHGLAQWRNSGKGRFVWEELDAKGNAIGGNAGK